ncbi:MAG: hypothetical protein EBY99_02015, partial [Burkholderiaceae bacterium]|nr:hypothetical protein [Burkholderiaceae bacterium]
NAPRPKISVLVEAQDISRRLHIQRVGSESRGKHKGVVGPRSDQHLAVEGIGPLAFVDFIPDEELVVNDRGGPYPGPSNKVPVRRGAGPKLFVIEDEGRLNPSLLAPVPPSRDNSFGADNRDWLTKLLGNPYSLSCLSYVVDPLFLANNSESVVSSC